MKLHFEKAYQQLNPQQKQAVDTIEGPVMVTAGPGTGKTQTLALRIANIIQKTDTPSHAILCLTFTESGKQAMRQRLLKFIGNQAYYIVIETFHSFCSSLIKSNPEYFNYGIFGDPVSDLKKINIITNIINQQDFETLKPAGKPYLYVNPIIQTIQQLKREGYTPDKFKKFLTNIDKNNDSQSTTSSPPTKSASASSHKQQNIQTLKLSELNQIFKLYQKQLHLQEYYDYEDMIIEVIESFKKQPLLLRQYQERFLYLLADEYQDTNTAQNEILFQLASFWGQQANIFVVGDPNQSIYRFQGASLENTINFKIKYSEAKIINLISNYRSQQDILTAADQVIQHNNLKTSDILDIPDQKLQSQTKYPLQPIKLGNFPNEIFEYAFIANQIKNLIKQGTQASEIAILYRNNADAAPIAEFLAKMNIPYNLEGGENILHTGEISRLLTLMKTINKLKTKNEDLDLFTLLQYEFWQIPTLDVYKISRYASEQKINFLEAMTSLDTINKLYPLEQFDKISIIWVKIIEWSKLEANTTFSEYFETLINQSGYLNWILKQPDAPHRLNKIQSLFKFIKQLNNEDHTLNLSKFLTIIDLMETNQLKIIEDDLDVDLDAVRLSTAHKSKGQEFEHVFIIKCYDTKWGNKRIPQLIKLPPELVIKHKVHQNSETNDSHIQDQSHTTLKESLKNKQSQDPKVNQNEDERRLFYVCLTRAKISCTITYSNQYDDKQVNPSMFITEIKPNVIENINTDPILKQQNEILTTTLTPINKANVSPSEKEFIASILDKFILSPTSLNTYLACPYKFKLQQILRTPRAKAEPMAYGTAIHYALEKYFNKYKNSQKLPPVENLISNFNYALNKEIIPDANKDNWRKRGTKNLELYISQYQSTLKPPLNTEKKFGTSLNPIYLDDIPITGKVDKIENIEKPNTHKTVRLIDYKTGKPKSRNAIEGKTKNSKPDYKRQLIFYQLLSQLDQTFITQVTETQLDFVEPNSNGKFKQETFAIKKEEVEELKQSIRETMSKIRAQQFPRTTNYSECDLCEFKNHCWPEGIPK